jgi:hypothetical protein
MIDLNEQTNTNRFSISLDSEEMLAILRAIYWYEDKLTNMEGALGRDNSEWDVVVFLRKQLSDLVRKDAKIL